MVSMLANVENAIWHAFDFLALESGGKATKSKLKVLTSNIGHILEVLQAESGLDDFRSTPNLSFEQYRYYLEKEVFATLPDKLTVQTQKDIESRVDNICWLICNPPYLERANPLFPAECVKQLWRIFCLLGEQVEAEGDATKIEVLMAAREVELIGQQLLTCMGKPEDWDPEEFDRVVEVVPAFKFSIFLAVMETKYVKNVDAGTLEEAVRDLHDTFISDVIRKGRLKRRMDLFPRFKEHWVVVQPQQITVYGDCSEVGPKGVIPLTPQSRVEKAPQHATSSANSTIFGTMKAQKQHRFYLFTNGKMYEFQANDNRSRLQWVTAMEKAIEFSGEGRRYQRELSSLRKDQREDELTRRISQLDLVQQTKAELEQEKAARVQAETQAALLSQEKEMEVRRMKELEDIRQELERLLEEEKQAKRDEEIVRTLQARMLTEEWERREQLERLQEEQKHMLEEERHKREEYEKMKEDREMMALEAEKRLRVMEEERMKLDEELKKLRERSRRVNIGQEVLEAKIKVREQECESAVYRGSVGGSGSQLNPSASFYVKKREEAGAPRYRPLRSASMRETSYSRSIRRRTRNDSCLGSSSLTVNNGSCILPSNNNNSLTVANSLAVGATCHLEEETNNNKLTAAPAE